MNVPQLRFKGFHDEWQKEQYRNIVNYCSNGFVGTVVNYYVSSNDKDAVRYIVGANVKPNKFDLNIQVNYVNKDFQLKYPKAQIHTNDMLMVQSGDIGTCCVVNEDLNNDYCHALIINRFKEHINPYFIAEYLNSNRGKQKLSLLFTGSTIKHINVKDLLHFIIRVPNFNEQSKVGQFFSKLDDLITKQMQKVTLLKQLKRGYLQKLFPQAGQTTPQLRFKGFNDEWESKKLNTMFDFYKGKGLSIQQLNGTKYPAIIYGELYTKYHEIINTVFSKSDSSGFLGYKNDLLFPGSSTVANGTAQTNALMVDNVQLGGDIIIARPKQNNVNSVFMSYQINSQKTKLYPIIVGTTITHMYGKDLSKLKFMITNLSEQRKIGSLFAKLDHLIELQNRKLALLKELKKGYLQKMFI